MGADYDLAGQIPVFRTSIRTEDMMRTLWLGLAFGLVLGVGNANADTWDVGVDPDNGSGTDNELIHGTTQEHDLGALPGPVADEDWFRIGQKRQSSYEVVVDSTTGDIGFNLNLLQLVDATGALIQNSVSVTPGMDYSHSLRFTNTTAATVSNQYVHVGPGNCGTACASTSHYSIRMMETTVEVARFNNAGSQVTVILTQNASENPINATFFYWSASGTLLQTGTLTNFPAHQLNVFPLTSFPALVGQGGHVTIAHDAPYGQLNVKTVALEPSTGFSFDTPGVYRGF
jgi:hypothetical protein